jgi:hypothetical protein
MPRYSAQFTQSPNEKRRYMLDYTLDLSSGEGVTSMATPNVINTPGQIIVDPLVVNGVVIGPGGLQVVFYVSGGDANNDYEVQFLATTTAGQIKEDVIKIHIRSDV